MPPEQTLKQIRQQVHGKPFKYAFSIDRESGVDADSRSVSLAFASDKPIDHWFGQVRLLMGKKNVRTDRLKSGAPLLMDHDTRDQIGVVEDFSFDADGMARATVRFGESVRASEIFHDVQTGIRQLVSVGFMIYELNVETEKKGEPTIYSADDWEPYEISIVAVPADISVGVGRSKNFQRAGDICPECELPLDQCTCSPADEIDAEQSQRSAPTPPVLNTPQQRAVHTQENTNMPPIEPETPVVETRSAEQIETARVDDIHAFADRYQEGDLARSMTTDPNVTLSDVRAAIRAKQLQNPSPSPAPMAPIEAAARQGQPIQFARSMSRVNLKAFKGEGAHERAYRCGMHFAAVLMKDERAMQYCRENGIALTRVQTGTDNTKGGFTVLPEFEQTIFDLRLQYGVARRVTDVVPMASDTKLTTRRTGGLRAYAVGPGQRGTYSNVTDDQFELVARKWMVLAKIEDELNEDSFISWADRLAEESAYAFSFSEDDALFNADGTSAYHGIVGITQKILGLSATRANIASAVVATGNTWDEITIGDLLAVVGKLPSFARQSGNVRWYCTSEFWALCLQRLALAGGGVTHAEFEGELKESFLGKPVEIVEAMQHTAANDTIPLLYGNMSQAATFGDRRGVTVKMTDSNDVDFESDLQAIKATERFDINVHDVGNADATAANRKAGPVIALLTAAS